ncbi:hypothetical protein HYALB_00001002 [Hymenoscyphus albidus]|uniref:DUF6594 domain-containing protein n=1 Tax=Hymenoscyphus albidus TaxID=595503 RepID=A0A9N9M1Y2_9HELO|nr:hypothetical protein HYALB_00001002 [Hymenoscyphus albidus]
MSGYTHLANFMAEKDHPILRKYKTLAARDLLFLQAELCHLEWKYKSVLNDDEAQEDERQFHARDWILLESSERRGLGGEQWAIALEIRTKLREYWLDEGSQYQRPKRQKSTHESDLEIKICYHGTVEETAKAADISGNDRNEVSSKFVEHTLKYSDDINRSDETHKEPWIELCWRFSGTEYGPDGLRNYRYKIEFDVMDPWELPATVVFGDCARRTEENPQSPDPIDLALNMGWLRPRRSSWKKMKKRTASWTGSEEYKKSRQQSLFSPPPSYFSEGQEAKGGKNTDIEKLEAPELAATTENKPRRDAKLPTTPEVPPATENSKRQETVHSFNSHSSGTDSRSLVLSMEPKSLTDSRQYSEIHKSDIHEEKPQSITKTELKSGPNLGVPETVEEEPKNESSSSSEPEVTEFPTASQESNIRTISTVRKGAPADEEKSEKLDNCGIEHKAPTKDWKENDELHSSESDKNCGISAFKAPEENEIITSPMSQTNSTNVIDEDGLQKGKMNRLPAACMKPSATTIWIQRAVTCHEVLDLSPAPEAKEYWTWADDVGMYFHKDPETLSVTWYEESDDEMEDD